MLCPAPFLQFRVSPASRRAAPTPLTSAQESREAPHVVANSMESSQSEERGQTSGRRLERPLSRPPNGRVPRKLLASQLQRSPAGRPARRKRKSGCRRVWDRWGGELRQGRRRGPGLRWKRRRLPPAREWAERGVTGGWGWDFRWRSQTESETRPRRGGAKDGLGSAGRPCIHRADAEREQCSPAPLLD